MTRNLRSLVDDVCKRGLASRWFFLRYADPHEHLRLRFHGDPETLRESVLPHVVAWASALVADGVLASFAFDAYEREVSRYGGQAGLDVCEDVFCADSSFVLGVIRHRLSLIDEELPMVALAAVTAGTLTDDLGVDASLTLDALRQSLPSPIPAGADYRRYGATVRRHLGERPPGLLGGLLDERARSLSRSALGELHNRGSLSAPITSVVNSLLHMHLNRLGCAGVAETSARALLARALIGRQATASTSTARRHT